jgi:hypothetical protein
MSSTMKLILDLKTRSLVVKQQGLKKKSMGLVPQRFRILKFWDRSTSISPKRRKKNLFFRSYGVVGTSDTIFAASSVRDRRFFRF